MLCLGKLHPFHFGKKTILDLWQIQSICPSKFDRCSCFLIAFPAKNFLGKESSEKKIEEIMSRKCEYPYRLQSSFICMMKLTPESSYIPVKGWLTEETSERHKGDLLVQLPLQVSGQAPHLPTCLWISPNRQHSRNVKVLVAFSAFNHSYFIMGEGSTNKLGGKENGSAVQSKICISVFSYK